MGLLKELFAYREMIANLVRKDLRGRYKGSVFGFLWTFLNPLLQVLVYSLVFSNILKFGINNFYLFLFVAQVPWIFFSTCISAGAGVIQSEKSLVVKIHFPREVIPIYFVISSFFNMLFCFVIVIPLSLITGVPFNPVAYLCLPVIMAVEFLLALGGCLIVSAINVYFRDLQHIMAIFVMAWYFLTPIIYPMENVPNNMRAILILNPMTPIVTAFRDVLYYGRVPHLLTLLHAFGLGIAFLFIGLLVFGWLKRRFAEVL